MWRKVGPGGAWGVEGVPDDGLDVVGPVGAGREGELWGGCQAWGDGGDGGDWGVQEQGDGSHPCALRGKAHEEVWRVTPTREWEGMEREIKGGRVGDGLDVAQHFRLLFCVLLGVDDEWPAVGGRNWEVCGSEDLALVIQMV